MTTLITGAGGFVGYHLTRHLQSLGEEVFAPSRQHLDIANAERVRSVIAETQPTRIYHLAAQSFPGVSWTDPGHTFRVNIEGLVNLLEAVRSAGLKPDIVAFGSSSEYAPTPDGRPIKETDAMKPSSPYAISKLAADHCARLYTARYQLNILRVRPFFLIGPVKTGDVCSDLARRVVAVERGEATEVPVGQLDIVRDFLDIRDGIEAIGVIAAKGGPGEDYNICSGRGYRIGDVLEAYKRLAKTPVTERIDTSLLRVIDERVKVGDPTKLKSLGWSARYSLEESLAAILDYWRSR